MFLIIKKSFEKLALKLKVEASTPPMGYTGCHRKTECVEITHTLFLKIYQ